MYFLGREPAGYWEMLHHVGPTPIIEPARLKTKADWIEAGRIMFHEADDLHLRTLDPKTIEAARTRKTYEQNRTLPLADNTIYGLRWVPTSRGVTLSVTNCAGCHLLYLPDDTPVPGAPTLAGVAREPRCDSSNSTCRYVSRSESGGHRRHSVLYGYGTSGFLALPGVRSAVAH